MGTWTPPSSTAVDPSAAVDSVFGRTGAVVAVNADYMGVVASALTGATQASRYVGATASGAPASGTFAIGDFIIDRTGKAYVCTVAGTPGTWLAVGEPATVASQCPIAGGGGYPTALVTNSLYFGPIQVPSAVTLTGIFVRNDNPASGNVLVGLFSAAGARVAQSASTAQTGTYTNQAVPFTAPYAAASGMYFAAIVADNATGAFWTQGTFGSSAVVAVGSFSVPATITPPAVTAFNATQPNLCTY